MLIEPAAPSQRIEARRRGTGCDGARAVGNTVAAVVYAENIATGVHANGVTEVVEAELDRPSQIPQP